MAESILQFDTADRAKAVAEEMKKLWRGVNFAEQA
jgi:hypothetical protein